MDWPHQLWITALEVITGSNPAGWIVAIGLTIAVGVAAGHLKVLGVSLGVTTVLFAGILYSWAVWSPHGPAVEALIEAKATAQPAAVPAPPPAAAPAADATSQPAAEPGVALAAARHQHEQALEKKWHSRKEVLEFLREFGLVLFVYCLGMMVGPGFVQSLRAQGVRWNVLAASTVAFGLGITALIVWWFAVPPTAAVGVMSGAITNTSGWAAAQQTIKDLRVDSDLAALTQVGYAVAYPFGVAGIIGSLVVIRFLFRIDLKAEMASFQASQGKATVDNANLRVANPGVVGRCVREVDAMAGNGVVISRIMRGDEQFAPTPDFRLAAGDLIHAVGSAAALDHLAALVGARAEVDLREAPAPKRLVTREVAVTNQHVVGSTIAELDFPGRCGATVTRIRRAGAELLADDGTDLHFADRIVVVGPDEAIRRVEQQVGNSEAELNKPQLIGLFLGIACGIALGSIPFMIPGLSAPVKLGLAGGPLVAALFFSRLGHLGRHVIFHVRKGANNLMREFGIALFLACVGLLSAQSFVTYAFSSQGLVWIGCALAIAMIPLLIVGIVARLFFKENYTALMGVLAGSCTDPPALAFANSTAGNELPGLAYATVYPLTMLLRIVGAQIFVLLWLAPRG
jgi:putative transport protein